MFLAGFIINIDKVASSFDVGSKEGFGYLDKDTGIGVLCFVLTVNILGSDLAYIWGVDSQFIVSKRSGRNNQCAEFGNMMYCFKSVITFYLNSEANAVRFAESYTGAKSS